MILWKLCWLLLEAVLAGLFLYTGSGLLLALAAALWLMMLGAVPFNLWLRSRLRVTAELPVNIRKGQGVKACLLVENPTFLPVLRLRCRIAAENRLNGTVRHLEIMTYALPKRTTQVELEVGDQFCGRLRVTVEKIRLYDCFCMIPVLYRCPTERSATIQPDTFEQQIRLLPSVSSMEDSEIYSQERPGSDLTETFQIREYTEGDSPRQIHWKLTQKFDRLIVRDPGLPVSRSVLVFWERTGESGDVRLIDAQAEIVATVCRTLANQSVQFTVGWNETAEQRCVLQPVRELDDLIGLLPRLLSARGRKEGVSGAELLLQMLEDRPCAHIVYVAEQPQPAVLELQRLSRVTMLTCGTAGSGIAFDADHYETQLAELEI